MVTDEDATAVPARMAAGRVRRIPAAATMGEILDDVATVIEEQSREFDPDD